MDMYADKWFKGHCHGCGVHTCEECSKHSCEFKGGVNMSLVTIILGKKIYFNFDNVTHFNQAIRFV